MQLNYNNYLNNLNDDDIVDRKENLFKFGKLKDAIETAFDQAVPNALNSHCKSQSVNMNLEQIMDWFDAGVECKILQAGSSGWKQGKLKINVTVEFIPDPPQLMESPLDEVRREIQGLQ